jgi:hypothetical protein
MSTKSILLFVGALFCADVDAAAPAYDGHTPMIETGPVWFDPVMSAEEQLEAAKLLLQSHVNIVTFYQGRLAQSRIVWCKTPACATFFAGNDRRPFSTPGKGLRKEGAQYTFVVPSIVVLGGARDFSGRVLTHEMSHMEFRARLHGASVPAWFNEGIASYIGGDQDHFCKPGLRGIDNLFELQRGSQWVEYTFKHRDKARLTYCQARNEVAEWIAERGGFGVVLDLLAGRSKGRSFTSLYGRQQAQLLGPRPAAEPKLEDDAD